MKILHAKRFASKNTAFLNFDIFGKKLCNFGKTNFVR